MLSPKIPLSHLRKMKGRNSIPEKVERIMREEKNKATHVKMIMKEHFDVKESEMEGSFSAWKKGLPSLYSSIQRVLNGLVDCGFLDSQRVGKTIYYWREKKDGQCPKCGFPHGRESKCLTVRDFLAIRKNIAQFMEVKAKDIVEFVKRGPCTEMAIAEHFGIPKYGGSRTRLWNTLKELVVGEYLEHDYTGRRGKPYYYRKDYPGQ